MIIVVFLLEKLIVIDFNNKLLCIIYIAIISLFGAIVYTFMTYKMGVLNDVLKDDFMKKIKRKLIHKR